MPLLKLSSLTYSKALCLPLVFILAFSTFTANAVVDGANNAVNSTDPQIAAAPSTPFLGAQTSSTQNPSAPSGDNVDTQNLETGTSSVATSSLAKSMQPNAEELSTANQKLLSHNAQLQREINSLSTQVNVLVNERSGQLFMYGAICVAISLIVGFGLGAFIFSRRDQW